MRGGGSVPDDDVQPTTAMPMIANDILVMISSTRGVLVF
jgi:hypothetical protein